MGWQSWGLSRAAWAQGLGFRGIVRFWPASGTLNPKPSEGAEGLSWCCGANEHGEIVF